MQKLVDEFPLGETSRHANHVEDSNVNVVSDVEPNHPIQKGLESNRGSEAAGIEKEDIVVEVIDADDNGECEGQIYVYFSCFSDIWIWI